MRDLVMSIYILYFLCKKQGQGGQGLNVPASAWLVTFNSLKIFLKIFCKKNFVIVIDNCAEYLRNMTSLVKLISKISESSMEYTE